MKGMTEHVGGSARGKVFGKSKSNVSISYRSMIWGSGSEDLVSAEGLRFVGIVVCSG